MVAQVLRVVSATPGQDGGRERGLVWSHSASPWTLSKWPPPSAELRRVTVSLGRRRDSSCVRVCYWCKNMEFPKSTNAEKIVNIHSTKPDVNCFELVHFCSMGYLFIFVCLFVLLLL